MILKSLVDYYKILNSKGEIPKPGYCLAKVSYALNLSQKGELIGVLPLKITAEQGKKKTEIPQQMEVPEQKKKTVGIDSNFLCENSGYVLGIDNKGKPERTRKCFEEFKKLHHEVLDGVDDVCAKALLAFVDSWNPGKANENLVLKYYLEEITSGANIVFHVAGVGFIHQNDKIRRAWEKYRADKPETIEKQCLVTGEVTPIARLHPSIKGVKGSQATGASIVSFNAKAYESYGHDDQQGLNAPVGEYASFAYTTALNYLLSDVAHRIHCGDTTVVYWAQSPKPIYRDLFAYSINPVESSEEMAVSKDTEALIGDVFKKIVEGKPIADFSGYIDKNVRFYVLGLAPNASRLSIRFFFENSFGNILNKIAEHYRNLEIQRSPNEFEYLPLWKLLLETVSPTSKDKSSSPLLSGSVMRSILSGGPYPSALYNSVILRIRAEHEVSRGKAAIIKAYLLRNGNKKYKEELTVSLNEQSNNKAYILGRLFAVLEKAQLDANPGINSTIKDRYFTSACATPATVFPVLLRLSHHHIAKSEYGKLNERRISELMDRLNIDEKPFPSHLQLEEQGLFILGYYHQQKANYAKKEKEDK